MFWRKNKKIKELFVYESCNFRSSYRVSPSEEEPVVLVVRGKKPKVVDIGAGGISFQNTNLAVQDEEEVEITLPDRGTIITTTINVVRISDEGLAHTAFKDIAANDSEAIHRYMLYRQKQELREKRAPSKLEEE